MSHTPELSTNEYRVWHEGYDEAKRELNCAGLNPSAYRECLDAIKIALPALLMAKDYGYDAGNAVDILKQVLANAQKGSSCAG